MNIERVEAIQFDGQNHAAVRALDPDRVYGPFGRSDERAEVNLTWMTVTPAYLNSKVTKVYKTDWVVRDAKGALHVYRDEEFQAKYAPVLTVYVGVGNGS